MKFLWPLVQFYTSIENINDEFHRGRGLSNVMMGLRHILIWSTYSQLSTGQNKHMLIKLLERWRTHFRNCHFFATTLDIEQLRVWRRRKKGASAAALATCWTLLPESRSSLRTHYQPLQLEVKSTYVRTYVHTAIVSSIATIAASYNCMPAIAS